MNFISIEEAKAKWNLKDSTILGLLENGYIKNAKYDTEWKIPEDYPTPTFKNEVDNFFPLLNMTCAIHDPYSLSLEQFDLLVIQLEQIKGNTDKSLDLTNELLKVTKSESIKKGCYMNLCLIGIAKGNSAMFKQNFDRLSVSKADTRRDYKEKALLIEKLHAQLYYQETTDWIEKGDFKDLSKEALPNARIIFTFNKIKNAETVDLSFFNFLLSETVTENVTIPIVYLELLMATIHHYMGNLDDSIEYINQALDTAMEKNWIMPLLEFRKTIGVTLDQEIKARDEEFYKNYINSHKMFIDNWNKVYEYYRGDFPTKDLNSREEEIMFYAINGKSNQEIADILCLSSETIKTNLKNIFQKLGVSKRSELKEYWDSFNE